MNIVVLAGGLSPERDVSLSSGAKACAALNRQGHHAILVDLFLGRDSIPDPIEQAFLVPFDPASVAAVAQDAPDLEAVKKSRKSGFSPSIGSHVVELCRAADITYIALHGGDGENGKLQAFFDLLGVKYTGSSSIGCALAMDKWVTKQLLLGADVKTPYGVLLQKGDAVDVEALPLPAVVKPCCGGSSIGISIARTQAELQRAIAEAFRYEDAVLVEAYIKGRELSAGIVGHQALPLIEIIPRDGFYDYAHKYQPGWTEEITPARFDEETTKRIQALALKAYDALHLCVYARIDFLLTDEGEAYCLEANTLPGMTPTSLLPQEAAANGVSYPALCDMIVTLSMEKTAL